MSRIELFELLHQGLVELNDVPDKGTEIQLIRYIELIAQWNRVFNLTAIRDLDAMVVRHLLDSLTIKPFIKGKTVLDVGTGAGLPGIPLAIMMPDKQFVLLDSNQKKTRFLQQTVYQLRLKNVRVVHQRVEEYKVDQLFDTVISRAFSTLREYLQLSKHLVRAGGQILAMKGVYPLTELQEVNAPFKVVNTHPLKVPKLDAERHVVDLTYEPETVAEAVNG
ncbi:MAG: 16S rRNA (guanine(527)-N(7))-methyltransferase RsmG [Gammaproteobacteria bacterium]|nr:16S rRNA (guanine(527)-N(7))-methyltransferase RsmG [Gammaproteobacteria bacterium]